MYWNMQYDNNNNNNNNNLLTASGLSPSGSGHPVAVDIGYDILGEENCNILYQLCAIPGFHRSVNEVFALLEC
jgi:hypothetical protein